MHRVKRYALEVISRYGDRFNDDFHHNKRVLEEVSSFSSKELRNEVAGYITSMIKRRQKTVEAAGGEALPVRAEARG
jgi:small subunit ribosomal protein S17e